MWRLCAIVAIGCTFHPRNGTGSGAPDAPPSCGPVACDSNATCANATCTCNTGFSGDGITCAAIDPCATSNGGCPAACVMTGPGTSQCHAPRTCADIAVYTTLANDTSVTLWVNQDPSMPWTAFCHNNVEYLTLPAGAANNFGQYTASMKSPGTNVRTSYTRARLDPIAMKIDICDQAFATSMGTLAHDPASNPGVLVTSMPLAVAMDCAGGNPLTGVGSVDLTGTPFVVTSSWVTGGNSATSGAATSNNGGRSTAITGGGDCGWTEPRNAPGNPFNTFSGSKLLVVAYSP